MRDHIKAGDWITDRGYSSRSQWTDHIFDGLVTDVTPFWAESSDETILLRTRCGKRLNPHPQLVQPSSYSKAFGHRHTPCESCSKETARRARQWWIEAVVGAVVVIVLLASFLDTALFSG